WNSTILASLAVVLLLACLYPLTRVRRRLRSIFSQATFAGSSLLTCYNEAFGGNRVITAYNFQEPMVGRLKTTLAGQFRLGIKMVQRTCGLSLFTHAIVAVGIASTLMLQGYLISRGLLTPGRFVAFIAALIMLYTPLKGIGGNFQSLQFSLMALERVLEKLDERPRIQSRSGAAPAAGFAGSIVYENVDFAYVQDRPVLRNVNLEIEKGRTIAFVGGSGGGKTTLVSLLPRFYDVAAGRILLDGTDIRDLELASLRNLISMVFQDNFLFAGTVRDNVLLGNPQAAENDLREALEAACLDRFVEGLPRKLDTEIGERGILLSGGQKQRLAIARAFIKKSPIVILDEATSALDNQSEAVVQRAIDNLMRDKTILIVAHRLSTVINADLIVVVENGEIVERGPHGELVRLSGGRYRALYENQLR
ncbi:MAG: ABC transporter ATP-binding protein/permease, partial [Planctomycetota bacterium]|nr:ABC transporter ATP-binding protein/permease [Planctomycetota bacterium]